MGEGKLVVNGAGVQVNPSCCTLPPQGKLAGPSHLSISLSFQTPAERIN